MLPQLEFYMGFYTGSSPGFHSSSAGSLPNEPSAQPKLHGSSGVRMEEGCGLAGKVWSGLRSLQRIF